MTVSGSLRLFLGVPVRLLLPAALVFGLPPFAAPRGQCQNVTVTILHSFAGGKDGQLPYGGLVRDSAGNFYGTTSGGTQYKNGAVFKLSPQSGGGWATTVIYSFKGAPDGAGPSGSLALDTEGNLYGTTGSGGTGERVCHIWAGCGTVFKLAPAAGGKWKETVLHSFTSDTDGQFPYGGLTFSHGNLFGTTFAGGTANGCFYFGCGTIFELTPSSGGQWKERVIYAFTGGSDGGEPWYGSLTTDASGNLYGTTTYTGCDGCSGNYPTVFELSPNGHSWTFSTLYTFTDYGLPLGNVVFDNAGNLYGTTQGNVYGSPTDGTVFELTRSGGSWSRNILYSFSGGADGKYPYTGVTFDSAGNFYGTTYYGGSTACSCGVVYKMAAGSGGSWSFSVLHAFNGSPGDGAAPYASVVVDSAGNVYGTTQGGGVYGYGTVYEVTP
jgi:uncharacterized repeat protein (TIGR03803 family)